MSWRAVISGIDGASRVRLEGETQDRNRLTAQHPSERNRNFSRHGALARLVDALDRLEDAHRHIMVLRSLDQRADVLWQARAAEARAGVQEFRPNSIVEPEPARNLLHIRTDALAKIGYFVD